MPAAPLRCHLLIGPPASGKTTLAGILLPLLQSSGGPPPVRAFANRSIISAELVRSDALANRQQAEQLETAIVERRRLVLERYRHASRFPDSPDGELRVWPLQLLFHNIGWYLVYELDAIGRPEGLIRSERLDRLALRHSESRHRRSED